MPNLTWMSLIRSYWMLQNARVAAFIVSELLRENQQGGKITPPPAPPRLELQNLRITCALQMKLYLSE